MINAMYRGDDDDDGPPSRFNSRALRGDDEASEAGEEIPQWEPVAYEEFDWSDEPDEPTDDPNYCFLCDCTQDKNELEQNPRYKELLSFIEVNFSKVCPRHLVKEAQCIYNQKLRQHTDLKKVWRKQIIYTHLEQHAPTARIMAEDALRTTNNAIRVIRDGGMFVRNISNKRMAIEMKNATMYLKLLKQRNNLLAQVLKMRGDANVV